jgi:hypothetical protein
MPLPVRLCFALIALAGTGAAAASTADSVYTPLDLRACRVLERIEEGDSVRRLCPGLAGIALFVNAGDGRFDVDAGVDNGEWESLPAFNRLGPRVEWRRRDRRPVAIIYRHILTAGERDTGSVLAVESVGRRGRPGCLVALIGGALPNANALARAAADRAALFRCGRDRPARRGVD